MHDISEQIQICSQFHVQRLEFAGSAEIWGRQDALETDFIFLDWSGNIFEFGAEYRINFREEKRFKVDGNVGGLEKIQQSFIIQNQKLLTLCIRVNWIWWITLNTSCTE